MGSVASVFTLRPEVLRYGSYACLLPEMKGPGHLVSFDDWMPSIAREPVRLSHCEDII